MIFKRYLFIGLILSSTILSLTHTTQANYEIIISDALISTATGAFIGGAIGATVGALSGALEGISTGFILGITGEKKVSPDTSLVFRASLPFAASIVGSSIGAIKGLSIGLRKGVSWGALAGLICGLASEQKIVPLHL